MRIKSYVKHNIHLVLAIAIPVIALLGVLLVFLLIRAFAPEPKHDFLYLVPSTTTQQQFTNSKDGEKPVYSNGNYVAYQHYYAVEAGKLVKVPIYSYNNDRYNDDYRNYSDFTANTGYFNDVTINRTSEPVKEPENAYKMYRYDVSEKKNVEISFEQAQALSLRPVSYYEQQRSSYNYNKSNSAESPDGFTLRCDKEAPNSVFDDYTSLDCSRVLLSGNNKRISVELLSSGTRNNKGFIFLGWIVSSASGSGE